MITLKQLRLIAESTTEYELNEATKNIKLNNAQFNTGYKISDQILLFNNKYKITVKASSYRETDKVTKEQESAYDSFKNNIKTNEKNIESALKKYDKDASNRFIPKTLLIQRSGEIALLLDDKNEPDEGIVFILSSNKIVSQDEYL